MSFLDEVRADRQPLAHVLKKHRGIRKIVEDLYPDRAHFIYELLQNAEDAGATEASFLLDENSVSFEHNGRPFGPEDIWAITDIGEGTKAGEEDKIGRFGVGFKAVFAYSETPHIWSPTFNFKITDLVLPTVIDPNTKIGQKTRFEFPFNNPKKCAQDAYTEVNTGLAELAETTLLFLSSLESIRWQIRQDVVGEVLRFPHSENHIEVLKQTGGKTTASSHFLRFSDFVEGSGKLQVAIAFALDHLLNIKAFDSNQPLAKQLKIVAAHPGRVAIFFPAEKETSGLRFHLHAPFVPELSRASIKETPANDPLFEQLANLAAASLHQIRDLNLLTGEFLGVLPNLNDSLPDRYQSLRSAIIEEMNDEPLTPTNSKSYLPARHLLQAKASLKDLLSVNDIKFLVNYDEVPPHWAIAAPQKNSNADRFLSSLEISTWDVDEFINVLETRTLNKRRYLAEAPWVVDGPDEQFLAWLGTKSVEWHQQFYVLLHSDLLTKSPYERRNSLNRLKQLHIVRLSNSKYSVGGKCYFPSDGDEHDGVLLRVARGVYSSGKSKARQEEARKFLEELEVREVGEADLVQAILEQRYTFEAEIPDDKTYRKDLKRFIVLVEKEPQRATMFEQYFIFKRADETWSTPNETYLDSPTLETGLSAYYDALGDSAKRVALSDWYQKGPVSVERFVKFAEKVGLQVRLEVEEDSCYNNPAVNELVHLAPGNWSTTYGINRDYKITGLKGLLTRNSEALSRLIWKMACERKDSQWLRAQFRKNSNYGIRESASQLVCILRDSAWIP
jgi:hypothetical protein